MSDIDTRLAVLLLWGGGAILFASVMLVRRWRRFRLHRNDRRQAIRHDVRRDMMSGLGLFITAFAAAAATAMVLFGDNGQGLRGFFVALALGAFIGSLLVMATEEDANGAGEADSGGPVPQAYDSAGDH